MNDTNELEVEVNRLVGDCLPFKALRASTKEEVSALGGEEVSYKITEDTLYELSKGLEVMLIDKYLSKLDGCAKSRHQGFMNLLHNKSYQEGTMLFSFGHWDDMLVNPDISYGWEPVHAQEHVMGGDLGKYGKLRLLTDGFCTQYSQYLKDKSFLVPKEHGAISPLEFSSAEDGALLVTTSMFVDLKDVVFVEGP